MPALRNRPPALCAIHSMLKTTFIIEVMECTVICHVCIFRFESKVLSTKTYKVFLVSFQKMVIVGVGALVDEALPCASEIDRGILQDESNPEEICDVF